MEKNTYIFIDVEAAFIRGKQHIIEIGAIKLSPNKEVEHFSRLIKPSKFKKLNSYIQNLTGITNEELMYGNSFKEVMNEFLKWCGDSYIFVTFGEFDRKILEIELERNDIPCNFIYPIVDFQQKIMIEHNLKNQPSLMHLLEEFNIPVETHHRALADANSLMKLFEALNGETLIKKQMTNKFILLLSEWNQSDDDCVCMITYVDGILSTNLKIHKVKSIKKSLTITEIEENQTTKQKIEPNTEIAKFLQEIINKMENKVLITRSNMKTLSRIFRVHECVLPKTEIVQLQSVLEDKTMVNQFLINDLKLIDYEQKICQLINQYSNNIKEEFSKRHLFKKDEVTL